ncbi:MAG: deoxyribodipyrimidine photo-lyase, partial [Proteobacteria bacterium]
MTIFWFRRDLRLDDNCALFNALSADDEVLPIFIFDPNILDDLERDDRRVTFIHGLLESINAQLKENHRTLAIFHGNPQDIFKQLLKAHDVKSVFTNHDYEPYATKRDSEISGFLKKHDVKFNTFKDQVI